MMEGKHAGDILSVGVAILTLAKWLPALAALFTIIWTVMRIMEGKLFRAIVYKITGFDMHKWLNVGRADE